MDHYLLQRAVSELGELLRSEKLRLATAESCTGGLLASNLTDLPGSSDWFAGSVVAYANDVKQNLLKVPASVLEEHGAVSEPCVQAMAQGVLKVIGADVSVAISGIAGPAGGTPKKPVGTIWMAWAWPTGTRARLYQFHGARDEIKAQSVVTAINGLLSVVR